MSAPQQSLVTPLMDDVDRDEKRHGNRGLSQRTIRLKRKIVTSERTFDVNTLPPDMRRVYGHLAAKFGEEYGLLFIFAMRTAVELHRAWHMTLLTNSILQSVKDKFGIRMTWNLGVVKCIFRVEDGGYELHRKIPYDYDSEYQDIYYRIAEALVEEKITVHEALIYQTEAKKRRSYSKIVKVFERFSWTVGIVSLPGCNDSCHFLQRKVLRYGRRGCRWVGSWFDRVWLKFHRWSDQGVD